MRKLWQFITLLFMIPAFILAAFEFFRCGQYVWYSVISGSCQSYIFLIIGIAAFVLASKTFFKKNLEFVQTLTHERAHLLVATLLLRRKVVEFNAKSIERLKEGENLGEVWSVGTPNIVLSLAPYMLPYVTFLFLLIRLMIKNEYLFVFDFIIGFSLMHHILCWKRDIGLHQTDIQTSGILRSYLYIWTFIFFNLAIILYSLGGGSDAPVNILQANVKWFSRAWIDIGYMFSSITR